MLYHLINFVNVLLRFHSYMYHYRAVLEYLFHCEFYSLLTVCHSHYFPASLHIQLSINSVTVVLLSLFVSHLDNILLRFFYIYFFELLFLLNYYQLCKLFQNLLIFLTTEILQQNILKKS